MIRVQSPLETAGTEIAEHKGIGHPDTICDEVAEAVSVALSRYYLEAFGSVLHHNVDKALLVGGSALPKFGGGMVTAPMELYLAGRATTRVGDKDVPVGEIAVETARRWLREHMRFVDPDRHIRIIPKIRSGSADLVDLFRRFGRGDVPLSNDTSFGVGFFPFTPLEQQVLSIGRLLNSKETQGRFPSLGEDIKVMGVQDAQAPQFTIAIAMVDRFLSGVDDYRNQLTSIAQYLRDTLDLHHATIAVNTADDYDAGSVYLTVTGTSAEGGDDGQVGRGNRINGLITPYRPMSLEAVAGKNPISHVGKIYNRFAHALSREIVMHGYAAEATVFIVSQIGKPINEPQLLDIRVKGQHTNEALIRQLARDSLAGMPQLWKFGLRE
ncbi:MAG: methionine adenosyltransferase [Saprospiraceae bacterium]|nr:methionine adenosyltransferase [Saprospiraceae bacterium]